VGKIALAREKRYDLQVKLDLETMNWVNVGLP
jgi:hypothetical protein